MLPAEEGLYTAAVTAVDGCEFNHTDSVEVLVADDSPARRGAFTGGCDASVASLLLPLGLLTRLRRRRRPSQ